MERLHIHDKSNIEFILFSTISTFFRLTVILVSYHCRRTQIKVKFKFISHRVKFLGAHARPYKIKEQYNYSAAKMWKQLFIITIFVIVLLVAEDVDKPKLLSRDRRYLVFPTGASFQLG